MSSSESSANFLAVSFRTNPYGWLVVFVMFLAMSMVSVSRASIGLAMPSLEQDMGWSRSFISTLVAWALLAMAVMGPMAGNLLDRIGPRNILVGGLVVTTCALFLTSQVDSAWQILATYSLLGGLGFGIVSKNIAAATVARHFDANRGLAVGVSNAGSTAGHIALLPIMAMILSVFGWRWGYLFLAGVSLLLLPVVWFFIRPGADDVRSPRRSATAHRRAAPIEEEVPDTMLGRLRLLFKNTTFLALLGSYTICGFTATGMIDTHFLPYAASCGIPLVTGATAYGVLATFNMGGMALSGYLSDRINRPRLLAVIYIMRGLSYVILLLVPVYDVNLIWVFAIVFGIFDYSTIPVTTSLVATHIGLRTIGLSLGVLGLFHSAGGALGAFLGGYLYDLFQKYDFVWVTAISVAMIAGILVLTIRENRGEPPAPVPRTAAA